MSSLFRSFSETCDLTAAGLNFVDMSCLPGRVMFMSWIGEHELQPLAQHEFETTTLNGHAIVFRVAVYP